MSRSDRVAELLKKEISEIIKKKMNDPRVGFVSITRVEVTDDLRHASVYVSVYEEGEKKRSTLEALLSAAGYIRQQLAPCLELRYLPEINFKLDSSIEKASRVFDIMQRLKTVKKVRRRKPC